MILLARAGLDSYRRAHRGENPRVDQTLVDLTTVALRYRTLAERGHNRAPGSATGPPSRQLTTNQAADRAGVSARTIRRAITEGRLPAHRVGRTYVLDVGDVEQWHRGR
ncbi:MAG TPA: helix-turn-helix domain-containing protein [Pseudonocardiaceae bacterium]|nr:helix-turn-helix domain-containing protein [Pseudonocardiaceae bacterium]